MPGGACARYQGIPLVAFELTRARGFQASFAQVELWVRNWPTGVTVQAPQVGEDPPTLGPAADVQACLGIARGEGEAGPVPTPGTIPWAGFLAWAEVQGGTEWSGQDGPFFVTDVVELRRSGDGTLSRVRVTLADARWRWGGGALRRWSYNRLGPSRERSRDSLRPDGQDWTSGAILEDLTGSLRGAPVLARSPSRLAVAAGPREYPPHGSALVALADDVRRYGLEDPCLTWDGRVELYDPGERAAQDHGGDLPENLPAQLRLWLNGLGQGHEVELGYPADYVLVVGGERIATVAVDAWDPVLDLSGTRLPQAALEALGGQTYAPLTEATVRTLTNGLHGLAWLRKWILGEHGHVGDGISREVAALLEEQAWRLFRLPKAVKPDGRPGANAHLLPLLARAESTAGRRWPVEVRDFAFVPVHALYRGVRDERASLLAAARAQVQRLRSEIRTRAKTRNERDPFGPQIFSDAFGGLGLDAAPLGAQLTGNLLAPLGAEGFSGEDLAQAVEQARALARAAKVDPGFAGQYEQALTQLYAQGEGDQDLLLQAGKLIASLEDALRAGTGTLTLTTNLDDLLRQLPDEIKATLERVKDLAGEARRRKLERERTRASGQTTSQPVLRWIHENLDRRRDPGASVYDAEAGVVRTSRLAGWLEDPDVGPDALTDTTFQPRAVRVLFGTHVRPRKDLLPGEQGRVETGREPVPGEEPDQLLPELLQVQLALGDSVSWYLRAYQRLGAGIPGAVPFVPFSADAERIRARALVVEAPYLVELIPLLNNGKAANALELDRAAFELAQGPMNRRDLIRSERMTVARPWRVRLDGVVASVTIRSRPRFAGFETLVATGSSERRLDPYRTRVRPKVPEALRGKDTREREGLRP